MPFGWFLLGSAAIGAAGSMSAADTQASAQQQAAATQLQMFNTITSQEQPFMQGGYAAENALLYGLGIAPQNAQGVPLNTMMTGGGVTGGGGPPGIDPSSGFRIGPGGAIGQSVMAGPGGSVSPTGRMTAGQGMPQFPAGTGGGIPNAPPGLGFGSLTRQFTPQDFLNNLDPGYGFALQTGGQAVRNADTPGVGALSGPALKDLMNFNVGTANQYYQNAFNRYTTQQNNIFARLSAIAGLGQNAASNTGAAGTQLGTGIAQAQAAAGGSLAGGIVGATNALGGNIPLAYLMSNQNPSGGWQEGYAYGGTGAMGQTGLGE